MAIIVSDMRKSFRDVTALDSVGFMVADGEFFSLLGPQKSGKSTVISCLSGLTVPDSGLAEINGRSVRAVDESASADVGVIFESIFLDPKLTVRGNISFHAALRGVDEPRRVDELAARLDVASILNKRLSRTSIGEQRRVDLARALVHAPTVLLLDEPVRGLDPHSTEVIWHVIEEELERGTTIFMVTGDASTAARADRVGILVAGRVAATGTPSSLIEEYCPSTLLLDVADVEVCARELESVGIAMPDPYADGKVELQLDSASARDVIALLGDQVLHFEFRNGTLEEVVRVLSGSDADRTDSVRRRTRVHAHHHEIEAEAIENHDENYWDDRVIAPVWPEEDYWQTSNVRADEPWDDEVYIRANVHHRPPVDDVSGTASVILPSPPVVLSSQPVALPSPPVVLPSPPVILTKSGSPTPYDDDPPDVTLPSQPVALPSQPVVLPSQPVALSSPPVILSSPPVILTKSGSPSPYDDDPPEVTLPSPPVALPSQPVALSSPPVILTKSGSPSPYDDDPPLVMDETSIASSLQEDSDYGDYEDPGFGRMTRGVDQWEEPPVQENWHKARGFADTGRRTYHPITEDLPDQITVQRTDTSPYADDPYDDDPYDDLHTDQYADDTVDDPNPYTQAYDEAYDEDDYADDYAEDTGFGQMTVDPDGTGPIGTKDYLAELNEIIDDEQRRAREADQLDRLAIVTRLLEDAVLTDPLPPFDEAFPIDHLPFVARDLAAPKPRRTTWYEEMRKPINEEMAKQARIKLAVEKRLDEARRRRGEQGEST